MLSLMDFPSMSAEVSNKTGADHVVAIFELEGLEPDQSFVRRGIVVALLYKRKTGHLISASSIYNELYSL